MTRGMQAQIDAKKMVQLLQDVAYIGLDDEVDEAEGWDEDDIGDQEPEAELPVDALSNQEAVEQ